MFDPLDAERRNEGADRRIFPPEESFSPSKELWTRKWARRRALFRALQCPDLKRKDRFEFSPDETIAMILRRRF